ncbi:MAG: PilZ domain-containing protein [Lachnospiraceae bacterium]|nr:PilZ domain-containing protein [Lachnospiraceae bacterium]
MNINDFEMAHSVELEILHDGKKTTLLTTVEGVIKDSVLLTPIRLDGKIVGFPPKFTVNLFYPNDNQVDCWNDVEVKAVHYRGHVYHSVQLTKDSYIQNRRGAYRVYIGENMNVMHYTPSGSQLHEVLIRDLSETGMCFVSKDEFTVGRMLRLYLRFKRGTEIRISSQLLWKRENPNRESTFLYGCKFTERNKLLVKYLMDVQQQQQRKKLGLN